MWSEWEMDKLNIFRGLTMTFMLRVVIVRVGGGVWGWIGDVVGKEIVVDELIRKRVSVGLLVRVDDQFLCLVSVGYWWQVVIFNFATDV